eukprot:symbB.v1.2.018256.t1/scaffold1449.1/size118046/7
MAIKEVLRRGRMSGVQLEQLLGHLTFISLGKREVLSIFGDSYTFVKRHYHDIAPTWKSVRKELLTWCRVSPLIVQDLRSEWSSEISAVDASEWGLGVTSTVVEVAEVEKVGRYNERWRFKDPSTSKPRSFVAKEDEKTEIVYLDEDAPEPPSKSTSFEAVPFEFIKTKWQVVGRHQWQRLEPMPVLEARASLFAVRRLMRRVDNLGKRHLILTDRQADAEEPNKTEQENNRTFGEGFAKKGSTSDMGHRNGREERPPKKTTAGNQKAESGQGHKGLGNATVILSHQCNFEQVQRTPQFVQTVDAGSWSKNDQDTAQEDGHGDESIPGRAVQEGEDLSTGSYALAALIFFHPQLIGKEMRPLNLQGLRGWRRLCPPRSRMPVPYEVVALLLVVALERGLWEVAIVMLLNFFLYLRPAQYQRLRVCDIVRPARRSHQALQFWVLLNPTELGVPSKTSQWDEALNLDLKIHAPLAPAMNKVLRLQNRPKQDLAFSVKSTEVNNFMMEVWEDLGLKELGKPHLYRLRHGGATHEIANKLRQTTEVQLRGRWQSIRSLKNYEKGGQNSTTAVHKGSRQSALKAPQPALSVPRALRFQVFLEIFSGSGRLGRAVMKHCSLPVLLWDITYGTDYDLCVRKNQWKILEWIRCGAIAAGHLGTPCNSFSRARDQPGGPPPLRSDSKPLGLEGLRPGDEAKVRIGNVLMRFSVRIMLLALMLGLPFTLENPRRSPLWICPPMLALLRRRNVSTVFVDFCMFKKKPTTFAGVHVSFTRLQSYRCIGSKRGICLHYGKPHLPLSGQTSSGEWLTKIAEPYPTGLCNGLAKVFLDAQLQLVTKDTNAVCGMRSPEREPDACWKAGCEGDQVEKLRASSSTWPAPNLLAGDDGTLFGSGGLYWENYFQSEVQELRQLKWPIEFSRRKHVFKSGAVYEGEWMGSERSGLGLQVWPDGAYYKGFWKANMASGKGMFKHSNGVVYTGQWRQSQAHGLGIYHDVDGEWMDDFPGGLGEARWTDKSKYAGNFLRGARHGTGEYTWPDGSKFTGQFKNNRIDGKGTWSSITGDKYTGQWQLSLKHGLGRYELADGQVYTGHYVEGEKDGFGIFEWSNGMSYKGYWNAGHPAAVAAGTLVEAPNEGEGLKVETQLSENQLRRV